MNTYRIGQLVLQAEDLPVQFEKFQITCSDSVDIVIEMVKDPEKWNTSMEYDVVQGFSIMSTEDGKWVYKYLDYDATLVVDADYSHVKYYPGRCGNDIFMILLSLPVRCKLLKKGILTMHGSCVMVDKKAYIFSAPSGVGKSTRANTWIEALGAEMISGDRPTIIVDDLMVFGGPWDGKEQIQHPEPVKLECICEIRRAPYTMVRKIDMSQVMKFLTAQSFVPMWDAELAMLAVVLMRKLARKIPIVRLFCDRTNQAALEAFALLNSSRELYGKECEDMKLKDGFVIRCVADEYMAIPIADRINDFGGTVILNEVAAFVLENMKNPISKEDLVELMMNEYSVERERATSDLDVLLEKLKGYGMIEE